MAIHGRYEFEGDEIVFLGGERDYGDNKTGPEIGNLISDQRFGGGEIEAIMRFEGPVGVTTGCEIIIYFEPATQYFGTAGLGGAALH